MASLASRRPPPQQPPRREDLCGLARRAAIFLVLAAAIRLLSGGLDNPIIYSLIGVVFGPAVPRELIRISIG